MAVPETDRSAPIRRPSGCETPDRIGELPRISDDHDLGGRGRRRERAHRRRRRPHALRRPGPLPGQGQRPNRTVLYSHDAHALLTGRHCPPEPFEMLAGIQALARTIDSEGGTMS